MLIGATAIAATSAADTALAQAAPQKPEAQQPAGGARDVKDAGSGIDKKEEGPVTRIESITVTANKRDEKQLDVAAPVSVLTYKDIERQQIHSFEDYVTKVPGFNYVSAGAGRAVLTLRGISTSGAQPQASVGTYIDETPFGSSSVFAGGSTLTPDLDPFDLERIEVLRGPQGTLYGTNTLGGLIKFVTVEPDTANFAGRVQVDGSQVKGGGNGYGARATLNVPVVADKFALRANVYTRTDPGFIGDAHLNRTEINENQVKGGRLSALWTPTGATSIRVTALAQNLSSDGVPAEDVDPKTFQPLFGDLQQRRAAGTGTFDARYRLYNATLKTDFGWSKLVAATSYSTLDATLNSDLTAATGGAAGNNALGVPGLGAFLLNPLSQTKATQEVRLESPKAQRLEWLGGVFYTRETGLSVQSVRTNNALTGVEVPSPFGIPIAEVNLPSTYKEYAGFGGITWHFTDRFDTQIGARYSKNRQNFSQTTSGAQFGSPIPSTISQNSSDSSTTFSLTPRYRIDADTLVYARIASGFLPGGPNVVPPFVMGVPTTFDPQRLVNYEIGLKSTLLDRRLTVDVSAFVIDWTKIPLATINSGFAFLTNGGKAKSQGLEASVAFIPVRGLTLSANAAYTDAKLTADTPPPTSGKDGDRLPNTPRFGASVNGDYDFALSDDWKAFVGASYRYVGTRKSEFTGSPLVQRFDIPSYHSVDLRAGVVQGFWTLSAFVKNVTDERGIVLAALGGVTLAPGPVPFDQAVIITPRTVGISLSRVFF